GPGPGCQCQRRAQPPRVVRGGGCVLALTRGPGSHPGSGVLCCRLMLSCSAGPAIGPGGGDDEDRRAGEEVGGGRLALRGVRPEGRAAPPERGCCAGG